MAIHDVADGFPFTDAVMLRLAFHAVPFTLSGDEVVKTWPSCHHRQHKRSAAMDCHTNQTWWLSLE